MKPETEAELRRLEALIPKLVAELPADEVLEAFAAEAETLTEQAGDESPQIQGRIDCMLASAGLIPGEYEGEPCLPG